MHHPFRLSIGGWKGANWQCLIPYFIVKSREPANMKAIPLSVVKVSGSLWVASSFCRARMVREDDMVDTETTSNHLEWESMTDRNLWPWNGQVKSR